MRQLLLLTFVLVSISTLLISCSRIENSAPVYSDPELPELKESPQNAFTHPIPIESAPPEPVVEELPEEPVTVPEQPSVSNTPSVSEPPSEYVTFTLEGIHDEVLLAETPDAGKEYVDNTYYIGDSITLGLRVFKILPEEHVFSEGSIDPYAAGHNKMVTLPDGTKVTAPQAVGYYKPQRVVITLGTNSVSWVSESAFFYSYGQLIDDIRAESPETVVIIQSIPPVTEEYESHAIKLTNKTINKFNRLLLDLAAEKSAYFLNTASVLKNERGYFNDNYQSGDGLHHNQASYAVWLNYLRTHAVPSAELS